MEYRRRWDVDVGEGVGVLLGNRLDVRRGEPATDALGDVRWRRGGEVQLPSLGNVLAVEAVDGGVVGVRRLLGRRERADPQPLTRARHAELGRPSSPLLVPGADKAQVLGHRRAPVATSATSLLLLTRRHAAA
jgi:hypothetical protein